MLVLLVDTGEQLGFPPVEGVNEGVTLSYQAGLELHTVLLRDRAQLSAARRLGTWGCQRQQNPCPLVGWKSLLKGRKRSPVHSAHLLFINNGINFVQQWWCFTLNLDSKE